MTEPRNLDTRSGFTIGVYLPPDAPKEAVEEVFDRISMVVYGGLLAERGNWDPMVVGRRGDVFHVDSDEHVYLSTSCLHDDHDYCKNNTGLCGNKTPGVCKFCAAPCICWCHRKDDSEGEGNAEQEST